MPASLITQVKRARAVVVLRPPAHPSSHQAYRRVCERRPPKVEASARTNSAIVMESARAQGASQHAPLLTTYQVSGGPLPTSLQGINPGAMARALKGGRT